MKKATTAFSIVFVALLVLCSFSLVLSGGRWPYDEHSGVTMPMDAPDPDKSENISTVYSQTKNVSNWAWYSFTPADNASTSCQGRIMTSTSKGSYPAFPLRPGNRHARAVPNSKPVFFNMSGCVGHLEGG